jgi:hypothetical protein
LRAKALYLAIEWTMPEHIVTADPLLIEQQVVTADPLLTEQQAAAALNVSELTLRRWRWVGKGPGYVKLGPGPKAAVRYRQNADIGAFVKRGHRAGSAT